MANAWERLDILINFIMKNIELEELTLQEMNDTNGGILGLVVAYALQAALVGSLAAGIYASAKSGYDAI
jgi:lactobin A/cerein 7B family class IIb bacteriocin